MSHLRVQVSYYEGPGIFDTGTLIMIPVPSSSFHDRRVVAKKSLLKQPASANVSNWLSALKPKYALTVTII